MSDAAIEIIRTTQDNPDFLLLVSALDAELAVRDGDAHSFYAQFNKPIGLLGVVVARRENRVVGCGAFRKFESETAEIKRMFVRLEDRGHRIATKILAELETWALESGFSACVLETGFKQPEAIALYKRAGYGVIPNYGQYADVANSVCMEKTLV